MGARRSEPPRGARGVWAATVTAVVFLCCASDEGPVRPLDPRPIEFTLVDVNPFSSSHGDSIAMAALRGQAVVLYAGSAG
ncbi:MAG: hypothetical protein GF346_12800 [Candidatus Eisenbacteria bacterium]|nr:hypothetical protein [Candidatus Latescibacterota bacterium]MBD3303316.1 hypothetical protein [Candidatus Eisenbacteria bacterium]